MSNSFFQIAGSKRSLHVQVAREIARKILSAELAQNDIIPSEMALCEQFSVSRTALREAIKLLTSKGLLESKPKVGTRVKSRDNWNFLDPQLLDWIIDIGDNELIYKEFLALRKAIEPEAAALAASNASAEQRILLSNTFQKMDEISANFDVEAWTEADMEFHRLVFSSTGNNFFLPFANVLCTMFKSFIGHSSEKGGTCIEEHRAIYTAIMAGDPDKARQANTDLLNNSNHRLPTSN
ncbi:GntR family transcriptional regulator [Psychromonas sp. psych-6C06]|uniref:FadR/GntR family transcriptional regulator n=1 Tax=Psychromonas sp. psych-6C06 TaxID=2058089 RepID=UPI000C3208E1|nr:FadR/GntR family transcriptional regulator [Psychromonas sp. psych-6C06]PKF60567.1 GntR family transcriptional regulator [Psychromonas sp. psych-6C06]